MWTQYIRVGTNQASPGKLKTGWGGRMSYNFTRFREPGVEVRP